MLLISDTAALQLAVKRLSLHVFVVTRNMLLTGDWVRIRDEMVQQADYLLIELPQCRTATGSRQDRKIADRIVTFANGAHFTDIALLAPRRSNAWQLASVSSLSTQL